MAKFKLAILGAGLMGRRHGAIVAASSSAEIAAIIDPSPVGEALAQDHGVPAFLNLAEALKVAKPDGLIIATPNHLHVENGLAAVEAGLPALIEKPVADDLASGLALVAAAEKANVPLLVGHHRRHNPMIARAKASIDSGALGELISAHGFFWLYKPEDYFDADWRKSASGGPILINLIHDIDLLRYLCGEISQVQALVSHHRGHQAEDSCVVLLRFANDALGTFNISDSVVAPWSWELTTGENPAYPQTEQSCYLLGGTKGSLSLPKLELWNHPGPPSWWEPINARRLYAPPQDPLALQLDHFCDVIAGTATPLVTGREALKSLQVILAIKQAAASGNSVSVAPL